MIRSTAEHGGTFVLASSLTLSDQQKSYFFRVLQQHAPDLLDLYQRHYPAGSYAPASYDWRQIAIRIRELCEKYGIRDRMRRPVIPGDKLAVNKRIVERLADQAYTLELEAASQSQIWAYRKAAWAVEDLEQDIRLIYKSMGLKGLQSIPNVGSGLAGTIGKWLAGQEGTGELPIR